MHVLPCAWACVVCQSNQVQADGALKSRSAHLMIALEVPPAGIKASRCLAQAAMQATNVCIPDPAAWLAQQAAAYSGIWEGLRAADLAFK